MATKLKSKITIPKGWYRLATDELVQVGDKFYWFGAWVEARNWRYKRAQAPGYLYIRRKSPKPKKVKQVKIKEVCTLQLFIDDKRYPLHTLSLERARAFRAAAKQLAVDLTRTYELDLEGL